MRGATEPTCNALSSISLHTYYRHFFSNVKQEVTESSSRDDPETNGRWVHPYRLSVLRRVLRYRSRLFWPFLAKLSPGLTWLLTPIQLEYHYCFMICSAKYLSYRIGHRVALCFSFCCIDHYWVRKKAFRLSIIILTQGRSCPHFTKESYINSGGRGHHRKRSVRQKNKKWSAFYYSSIDRFCVHHPTNARDYYDGVLDIVSKILDVSRNIVLSIHGTTSKVFRPPSPVIPVIFVQKLKESFLGIGYRNRID